MTTLRQLPILSMLAAGLALLLATSAAGQTESKPAPAGKAYVAPTLQRWLDEEHAVDWESETLWHAFIDIFGESRKPCVAYLNPDLVVLNSITLKKEGTAQAIVAAAAKKAKMESEPYGNLVLIGTPEQLKHHRAIRERNARTLKRLAENPAHEAVLKALRSEVHCEFAVTQLQEILDYLAKKSKLEIQGDLRDSTADLTLNNRATLQEVLNVMAVQGAPLDKTRIPPDSGWQGFDWTTDGKTIYFGTPSGVAKFEQARP